MSGKRKALIETVVHRKVPVLETLVNIVAGIQAFDFSKNILFCVFQEAVIKCMDKCYLMRTSFKKYKMRDNLFL